VLKAYHAADKARGHGPRLDERPHDQLRIASNIRWELCVYMSVTEGAIGVAASERCEADAPEQRLESLFETHHRRLYRLARRLVATGDEARDLVQDTFVRAAQTWRGTASTIEKEEAWLVRTLVNLCRDRWRRAAVRRRFIERHINTSQCAPPNAETSLIAHDTVWRALRTLTPRRRAVIVLHELEGVDLKDIAILVGISVATVRWHLSLGRRELERVIRNEDRS
jgi:RNA polymerase sigma-70 factor (ECF subfamily)